MSRDGAPSNGREFTCSVCGETYEGAWTEEQAELEKTALFGAIPLAHCAVLCDTCWQKDARVRYAIERQGKPPFTLRNIIDDLYRRLDEDA